MHEDRKRIEREIEDAQARWAERLDIEVDCGTRYVVLDGRRLGKLAHESDGFVSQWKVFYWVDGEWVEGPCSVEGELEDIDDADLHGVGCVADAISRGQLEPGEGER